MQKTGRHCKQHSFKPTSSMTDMDNQQLKKIYSAIEVLRKIGVEPNADQLSRLSQIEEEILQQTAKAFANEVNAVRRPFMLQLDYEPDNMPSLTIVIDDKTLPIALPKPTIEETVPEKRKEATPEKPKRIAEKPRIIEPTLQFEYEPELVPEPENKPKPKPKAEPVHGPEPPKSEDNVSSPADDFFATLYSKPKDDDRPKRIRKKYSLNGSRFMKKEDLVFEIIRLYLKHHPYETFRQLQQVFSDDYCADKFKSRGFLVSEGDLENWFYSGKYNFYHGNLPEYRLVSADGIGFYNYSSWTHETIIPIIKLAESLGYRITTDK